MLTPTGATVSEYWQAIKDGNPTHVKMEFIGQNVAIEDGDIDIDYGVSVEDVFNGDTDLTFGRAVMKEMSTRIFVTDRTRYIKWTGEFDLSFGVEIGGVTNWVKVGTFYGERPQNVSYADVVEFTAHDRMQKFETLIDGYIDSLTSADYPISVETIYEGICTYVGVSADSNGVPLANAYARTFDEGDLDLKGYTCRDVLAYIAGACGCYAKITAEGKCKLAWFDSNTSYKVTPDEEFHIEHADLYDGMTWNEFDTYTWDEADMMTWDDVSGFYQDVYGVYGVKVKQSELDIELNYPSEFDQNVYVIMDNPFLVIEDPVNDPDTYVKPIYERLSAFGGQLPMHTECVGNWLVEAGDIITIYVVNEMIESPVFYRTFRWNSSCVDTYETTGNKRRMILSHDERERIVTSRHIRLFVKDNYYQQQSGIDILPAGVEIDGSKYIKLKSGAELDVESGGDVKVKSGGSFGVASGGQIDINASGNLKLTGSTVEIKSGSTFNVDSTNFKIDSDEEYVKAGDWQLDPRGIVAEFYNSLAQTNCMIMFGRPGYVFEDTVPSINILSQVMAKYNNKYSGGYSFMLRQPNVNTEYTSFDINMTPGFNPPAVTLTASHYNNGSVAVTGTLGTSTNKWDVYGKTVRYDSLVQNSSKEVKHDIKALPSAGEKLDKLKPVTFVYDSDPDERTRQGLIYEDTVQVMPEICTDNEGEKAISYVELIPTLLKEIQDLRARIKTLEERLGE